MEVGDHRCACADSASRNRSRLADGYGAPLASRPDRGRFVWLGALRDPARAVDELVWSDGSVESTPARLRKPREEATSPPATPRPGAERALPALRLMDGELTLHDERGTLVNMLVTEASLSAAGWQAALERIEIGDRASEFVGLENVQLSGPMTGRRPRFARGSWRSELTSAHPRRGRRPGRWPKPSTALGAPTLAALRTAPSENDAVVEHASGAAKHGPPMRSSRCVARR